jgi:hypothetical protein
LLVSGPVRSKVFSTFRYNRVFSISFFVLVTTSFLVLIIYSPIFSLGVHLLFSIPIRFTNTITSLLGGGNVLHPYIGGLSIYGSFASMFPAILIGIFGLLFFLRDFIQTLRDIKLGLYSNMPSQRENVIIHAIYFSGLFVPILMMAYLRPRVLEAYYLFIIATSLLLVKYFSTLKVGTKRIWKRQLQVTIMVSVIVLATILSSGILINEPLTLQRSVHNTQLNTAKWCAFNLDAPYFADRKLITLIMSLNPYAKIKTPYFTYENLDDAEYLYSDLNDFARGFMERGINLVVLGGHNYERGKTQPILLIPNVGTMKGLPTTDFSFSRNISKVYTNSEDMVLILH